MGGKHGTLEFRFWRKVNKTAGCWVWTAYKNAKGYGVIGTGGTKNVLAHRQSYLFVHGSIPDDCEIDHKCRNRACVNPDHLEAVTHRVNVLRGTHPSILKFHLGVCANGHDMTGDNVYIWSDGKRTVRQCRSCERARSIRRLRAKGVMPRIYKASR